MQVKLFVFDFDQNITKALVVAHESHVLIILSGCKLLHFFKT